MPKTANKSISKWSQAVKKVADAYQRNGKVFNVPMKKGTAQYNDVKKVYSAM